MAGRYFLGVEVPAEVCGEALIQLQKRLAPHLDVKRWYSPEQMHLTVQFMGNLEAAQVEQLTQLVAAGTRGLPAFELELGAVGWFPRAKVVWCGVQGEMAALQDLQRHTVQALAAAFEVDAYNRGAYSPHITLGRLHSADGTFRPEAVASPPPGLKWRVEGLHLYESVSAGKSGPQYPIRHTFALQK
jgi:2'-5' RNA ligase